jgi:cysteine-rich repeat protein
MNQVRLLALIALSLIYSACSCDGKMMPVDAGGAIKCSTPSDCPAVSDACLMASCENQLCGIAKKPVGTKLSSQVVGDCKVSQCDGQGAVENANDNSDLPVDGNECTDDVCAAGAASNPAKMANAACGAMGALKCTSTGQCVSCLVPADCGADTECQAKTCVAGVCGVDNKPQGLALAMQTAGNCKIAQCNGSGQSETVDDNSDVPVDTNQCTNNVCTAGVPSNPPTVAGTMCSETNGTQCNGSGACVQCLMATDCPGTDNECQRRTCTAGACGISFTPNNTATTSQTASDCKKNVCNGAGQIVSSNDNADVPNDNNACTLDSCNAGLPVFTNGPVGVSCGAMQVCNAMGQCTGCNVASDCAGTDDECKARRCNNNICSFAFTALNTAVSMQTANDCKKRVCDGVGNTVVQNDNTDIPLDDLNQCTGAACAAGVPQQASLDAGTPCTQDGGIVCNAAAACVGCLSPSMCPGVDTECRVRTCVANGCGFTNTPAGTLTTAQVAGDCQRSQCDGNGNIVSVALNTDVPADDGNQCTSQSCNMGAPVFPVLPVNSVCSQNGGTLCSAAGTCVGCNTASQCAGTDTACQTRTCVMNACGVSNATAGTVTPTQIAGDCQQNQCNGSGAIVSVALNSDIPADDGNQCTSQSCNMGAPVFPIVPANTACNQNGGTLCSAAGVCVGCTAASQCPGMDTACQTRTCLMNACGVSNVMAGTVIASQVTGDCQQNQCNGTGAIVSVALNSDVPADDGNQCTTDTCNMGMPVHPPATINLMCNQNGGVVCSGVGTCVACNAAAQCSGNDNACQTRTCLSNACGFNFVAAGTATPMQTTGDCQQLQCNGSGTTVSVAANLDVPADDGNQCTTDTCNMGAPVHPAVPVNSACMQNGGSFCSGIATCVACNTAAQCPGSNTECQSRTCLMNACGVNNAMAGTVTSAQTAGDCQQNQCNGTGAIVSAEFNSDSDDGNQCTADSCNMGAPVHTPVAAGTACNQNGGTTCSAVGTCVASACGDHLVTGSENCEDGNAVASDGCSNVCVVENGHFFEIDRTRTPNDVNDDGTLGVNTNDFSAVNADGPFSSSVIIHGTINPVGDDDVFAITNPTASAILINLETFDSTLGACAIIDTNLFIRNAAGTQLANDDDTGINSCSKITGFSLAANTTVYAQVIEFGDNDFINTGVLEDVKGYQLQVVIPICGNNVTDPGFEQCDDGNTSSGDGCNSTCTSTEICGNKFLDPGEQCDDGNLVSGDGCSSICQSDISCAVGQTPVIVSNTASLAIPDNNVTGASSLVNVTTAGGVKKAIVTVGGITHANTQHIDVSLISPLATTRNISDDNNTATAGANYKGAIFGEAATSLITVPATALNPFTGTFQPETTLATTAGTDFLNQNALGTWALRVADDTAGATGTLDSWTLALCLDTVVFCGNGIAEAGEECDTFGASATCNAVCQLLDGCGDGNIDPGEFCDDNNITSGDGCSNTCQPDITCAVGQTPIVLTNTTSAAITDNNTANLFPVNVTTAGGVKKVIATIGDIAHTTTSHLDITLQSPLTTIRNLSDDNGAGANYRGTTLSDTFPSLITAALSPFTGPFRPEASLSTTLGTDFLNQNALGTWNLRVIDDTTGIAGTYNSWALALCLDTLTFCGNNSVDPGEECDTGGVSATCNAACQLLDGCGDGNLDVGEFCDDNNIASGDGCSSVCQPDITCGIGETAVVLTNTTPVATVDDNNTGDGSVLKTVTVATSGVIRKVFTTINITHAQNPHLDIYLQPPHGAQRTLAEDRAGADFTSTLFSDFATLGINAGTAPFSGSFTPVEALSGLNNQSAQGTWGLRVTDDTTTVSGTVSNWSLALCVDTAVSSVCGNGIVEPTEVCDDANSVSGDGCSSTCQLEVICGAGETFVLTAGTGLPQLINDNFLAGASSVAPVTAVGTVRKVVVVVGSISHKFMGDVDAFLVSPLGTTRTLWNVSSGAHALSTTLDDAAPIVFNAAGSSAPYRGRFRPQTTISGASPAAGFAGEAANGAWTLRVVDNAAADSGLLSQWRIGLCIE